MIIRRLVVLVAMYVTAPFAASNENPEVYVADSIVKALVQARMSPGIRDTYRGAKTWPQEGGKGWKIEIETTDRTVWLGCTMTPANGLVTCRREAP